MIRATEFVSPAPSTAPRLVGLIGKKRAGKDTFAAGLIEMGFTRYAFADNLKTSALAVDPIIEWWPEDFDPEGASYGCPCCDRQPWDARHSRLADLVSEYGWEKAKEVTEVRRLLQAYGVGIRALDEDFWVRTTIEAAVSNLAAGGASVLTDVRFPNEAEAIKSRGGILIRVERPGLVSTDEHVSETALDGYATDLTVRNDGTADELVARAALVLRS